MDKQYWENYYKNSKFGSEQSSFALFFMEEYQPKGSLVELGCGNGRDSLFFAKRGLTVLGIDQCENAIDELETLKNKNVSFIAKDFTNLSTEEKGFDNIYTRFTLHSIVKDAADRTIGWAAKNLNVNGYLAIEVRSVNDELFEKGEKVDIDTWYYNNHSRRFVRLNELIETIEKAGLKIVFQQESKGLAVYKTEDPMVIRLICTV